ncbi:hypothetical protein E2C01_068616 [Portunus trituberculatus]|uniref:Uncharacterized protein n=1 Tax=Portunus trituberculatus TaxID=210409 RepID=A0A5B7HMV2_PORTR|nr:hypothetical protein [Portunus trituberculatus]
MVGGARVERRREGRQDVVKTQVDQFPRGLPSLFRLYGGGSGDTWSFIRSSISSRTAACPQCKAKIVSVLDSVFGLRPSKLCLMGEANLMAPSCQPERERAGRGWEVAVWFFWVVN